MQTLFPLDGGYALKITTAKWYTPSGRSIQRERKFENGKFVEAQPDSLETEAKKKSRPAYRSDAGRIVYGGGGITPDILVRDDTLTTAEQTLSKAFAPKPQDVYVTLADYALELSRGAGKDFKVQPAVARRVLSPPHGQGRGARSRAVRRRRPVRRSPPRAARRAARRPATPPPSVAISRSTRRSARRSK